MLSMTSTRCKNKLYICLGRGSRKQKGIRQNVSLEIRDLSGWGEVADALFPIFSAGGMDSVLVRMVDGRHGLLWSLAGVGMGWGEARARWSFWAAQQFPQHSPLLPEGLGDGPLLAAGATLPASLSSVGLAHRWLPPQSQGVQGHGCLKAQLVEICFPGLSRRRGGGGMRALAHGKGGLGAGTLTGHEKPSQDGAAFPTWTLTTPVQSPSWDSTHMIGTGVCEATEEGEATGGTSVKGCVSEFGFPQMQTPQCRFRCKRFI